MIQAVIKTRKKAYYMLDGKVVEIKSLNVFLNNLATKHLMSIKEYKESVKKILKINYNIPIYFNKINIFFSCKSPFLDESIYVNYYALIGVAKCLEKVQFIFKNGDYLLLNCDIKNIKKQFEKCKKINDYFISLNS